MSFPSSNFERNSSTYVIGKSFWHYLEQKIDCWTSRYTLWKKILNPFVCVEIRILVDKLNVYEVHILTRPLLQTCRLETTSLCLNTLLYVNKKFSNSHYFYSKYCKPLSFMCFYVSVFNNKLIFICFVNLIV